MAAIALTTDTSALTAIGNDFGFDDLFARQVEALCLAGDVAIGISTSGQQRERDSRIGRGACGRRRDGGICRRWWRPARRAGGPPRLRTVDEHRSSSGDAHGPWPRAVRAAREGRRPVTDRFVTSRPSDDDAQYEAGLRPRSLDEYIGQDRLSDNLHVAIAAARGRREALDHVLLYGPPGLGKTTLAYVIANEMGVPIRATAGPVIEKSRRPRRHAHRSPGARGALHRRDPPDGAGDRRDPLSGDGGLRARYRHRTGTERAIGQGAAAEVHVDRRDDARRAADLSAARAVRHRASPRLLHRVRRRGNRPPLGAHSRRDRAARCGDRNRAALARNAAHRQPSAAPRPRLRAGARRWTS